MGAKKRRRRRGAGETAMGAYRTDAAFVRAVARMDTSVDANGRGTRRLNIMARVQARQRHGGFATHRPKLSAPREGLAR
jgi:hypothetical protein